MSEKLIHEVLGMLNSLKTRFKRNAPVIHSVLSRSDTDTRSHVNEIQTQGFTVIKNAFTDVKANQVVEDYEKWCNARLSITNSFKKSSGFNSRLVNFHTESSEAFSLFESDRLLGVTDSFFNAETVVYTSLFFHEGTEQDIHRDAPYFCTFPEQKYLGVWFALEDSDEKNGALNVIPGGHKLSEDEFVKRGEIFKKFFSGDVTSEQIGFVNSDLWSDYQAWVYQDSLRRGLKVETLPVKRGDIVIWHPMLPHGGSKIQLKGLSRRSMVMHVTPADTQVHGCYLYFAPHLPFSFRKMHYRTHNSQKRRRFFENECGFMKDE